MIPSTKKTLAGTSHVRQLASILVLGCALPANESAADIEFTPSLEVSAAHDTNIFLVPRGQRADQFVRVTPGIVLDYTSGTNAFTASADYIQDAEYYKDNTELNSAKMRQIGTAIAEYRVSERFSFGVNGAYAATPASGELNVTTGLQLGRVPSERKSWGAFTTFRFSPTLSGGVQYNMNRDRIGTGASIAVGTGTETGIDPDTGTGLGPGLVAAVGGDTEEAGIRLDKNLSPTDTLLTAYTYRSYDFDNGVQEYSHTPTVGWFHEFSGATSLRVQAGPRIFSDTVEPDVYALLSHNLAEGREVELSYTRTESVVAGIPGKVESQMADIEFDWQHSARMRFNGGINYGTLKQDQSGARIAELGLEARYRLSDKFYLTASWVYTRQRESYGPPLALSRNVVAIGFQLLYPAKRRSSTDE